MPSAPPPDLDVVDYIAQTRDSYAALGYDAYRWADNPEPVALAPLPKPLDQCRVALIASGGVYRVGQVGFTHKDDLTHREIPADTHTEDLRVTHFAYDQTNARQDPNVVFPLAALRALVEDGTIGSLTSHALTFMGGIYSQRRLTETLQPALVERVQEMEADVALLVPV